MNWELSSPTKRGISVWLQYHPAQSTASISWNNSWSFFTYIILKSYSMELSLLFHHCVTRAKSRIQLIMPFCPSLPFTGQDFGQAYLIGTLMPIGLFFWRQNLLSLAFPNTPLAFQKLPKALTLGMIMAKRLVLKNCKSSFPPSFWIWFMYMISVIQMKIIWFLIQV